MVSFHQSCPAVVIDTNILMVIPTIHRLDWGVQPITVYVLDAVVNELRGLARDQEDRSKAAAAQEALSILDNMQRRSPPEGTPLPNNAGRLVFAKAPSNISPPLDPTSVDHQQIALALIKQIAAKKK